MITYKEIIQRLQLLWPDLKYIWCFDQEYICPSLSEVSEFLDKNWIHSNGDCDDWALQLHAKVKRYANWSFGEVFADKVNSWSVLHNLNIGVFQEGIFLIDAKAHTIRQAHETNDHIIYARF